MELHWVDAIIIIITAFSSMFGIWRGFVREVLSLLAWIAALLVARVYSEALAPALSKWIASETIQQMFAFAILFMAVLILGALLNHLMAKLISISGLKLTDRLLGAVFGVARGVVIVMVFVYFGGTFFQSELWWGESQLIPYGEQLVEMSKMFVIEAPPPVS